MTGSIVVGRSGALGDTILTLPALQAMRDLAPDARLEVVGSPAYWQVAAGLVDAIHSVDDRRFIGLLSGVPGSELIAFLRATDTLILWTQQDRTSAFRSLGILTVCSATPYPPPGVHAAAWLFQTLGIRPQAEVRYQLHFSPAELVEARLVLDALGLERPVLLHPGAGATWKRWPAQHFGALAQHLVHRGHEVALIEGPADTDAIQALQRHAGTSYPILRQLSVRVLAAVLSYAALYIGNDSGVTHLAGISGAPVLALFGPTDPAGWRPLGACTILRTCSQATMQQGQVRVCHDPDCMARISVSEVIRALENLPVAQDACRSDMR